ncbi:MAG: hypothetical protein AAGE43_17970 [Pseudomonadota bacterium]
MVGDKDQDLELDLQIRAHFRDARAPIAVPVFESVMANAEAAEANVAEALAKSKPWQLRLTQYLEGFRTQTLWAGAAAAAIFGMVLVVAVLITPAQQPEAPSPTAPTAATTSLAAHLPVSASALEGELLASLGGSTHWRAPSDRWPSMQPNIDIYRLPEIGDPQVLKEKNSWL